VRFVKTGDFNRQPSRESSTGAPERKKKFGKRATGLKRALANEERKCRHIEDGAGKRYLVRPPYVLRGSRKRFLRTTTGTRSTVRMMSLSPSTTLQVLSLCRTGETRRAAAKLLEMMSQNVDLLPILVGEPPRFVRHLAWLKHGAARLHHTGPTGLPASTVGAGALLHCGTARQFASGVLVKSTWRPTGRSNMKRTSITVGRF